MILAPPALNYLRRAPADLFWSNRTKVGCAPLGSSAVREFFYGGENDGMDA